MKKPARPSMPEAYGIKPVGKGRFVAWEHVERQLEKAVNYWIVTASPDGRPHAVPVWGVWYEGSLYFSTDAASRTGVNLAANNRIVVHLESGDDVVILEGRTVALSGKEVTAKLDRAYHDKYGWRLKGMHVLRLEARKALAWAETDFTESATRWRWPAEGG